tara:strand:+ start:2599 stop:3612 length:1014 start_codon:yes stop_codon:yes gene_type:complete
MILGFTIFLLIFLQIALFIFFSRISININLVDTPNERKIHIGKVPLVGGIVIYFTYLFYFLLADTTFEHKIIIFSSLIIFFVGLYDDKFNLGVSERIFFQIISCLIVVGFGIRVFDIGNYLNITIYLGGFGIVLSCLTIIGFTNAINFSDGLDGLASGYILNGLIMIIIFSIFGYNTDQLEPLFFLIIFVAIFILSNFGLLLPRTFLGDAGSTSLGFLVACYLVYFTLPENRHFHPALVLWACPFPIFDFLTVFIRRILKGINPFRPDRRHLHYLLIKQNYKSQLIPLYLVTLSFFSSISGFLVYQFLGSLHTIVFFIFLQIIYFLISINLSRFEKN